MALTTQILAQIGAQQSRALDLVEGNAPLTARVKIELASGTGSGQADVVWSDRRTLSASATEDLDLAGSLTDAFGQAFTPARIKGLYVAAQAANTNNVNLTRPASNGVPLFLAAGDGLPIRPGGVFLWAAQDATAVAVTASTGDLITLTNSAGGTSVTYDVVIVGCSA